MGGGWTGGLVEMCLKLGEKVWMDRWKGEQSSKWPKDTHSQQYILHSQESSTQSDFPGLGVPWL